MSARIFDLATVRQNVKQAGKPFAPHSRPCPGGAVQMAVTDDFAFWSGASKERYVHTIYSLFDCPELPRANYMLVHRAADGRRSILEIGQTRHRNGSENLAMIRHNAAVLGANEVHIHYLPDSERARELVEFDLRAGQFGTLAAQPMNVVH